MATDTPVLLSCPKCQKKYKVPKHDPSKTYRCKECKAALESRDSTVVPPAHRESPPEPSRLRLEGEPDDRVREIPVRLGRYKIEAELGRGAMGVVYKGRQEGLDRPVAIKMILGGAASNAEMISRFKREARAAAKLKHPSIVAIHEIGDSNGMPFFTMEYIEGRALDAVMKEGGPMSFQKAARLVRDVARAVHHAHQHGIIHRDLKPQNILVDKNNVPHVTDFGLAKDLNSQSMLSMTGDIMGTPGYMPPEQAEGLVHQLNARCDIYSLGACLYHLVCGRAPFNGPTVATTIYALINELAVEPIRINPQVPPDLSAIVMKALEKDPDARYETAEAFAEDLEAFLHGRPVAAHPQSQKTRELKWSFKRHKKWILLAAGAVLIGLLGTFGALLLGRSYLDDVEKNLKSPAVAPQAFKTLILEFDRFKGKDRTRAGTLAAKYASEHDDLATRTAVIDVAESKGVPDEMLPPLRGWVRLEDPPELCLRLIKVLAARPDREAPSAFIERLYSSNKEIKREAVRALVKIPDIRAFGPLGALITDPYCGADAREALQGYNKLFDAISIITSAPGSSVINTLSTIGAKVSEHNQKLENMLDPDNPGAAPKPPDPVDALIKSLHASSREERMSAATLLGQHGDPRAVEALFQIVATGDDAAMNAAASLVQLNAAPLKERLVPLLKDSKPVTRRGAAYCVGKIRDKSTEPALKEAYAAETDKPTKEMMAAAIAEMP